MDHIDYDPVATLYDLYVETNLDHDFFSSRVPKGGRVLELTSGTGRLSLALVRAGALLTCVDISREMLQVLADKLAREGLSAELMCADVQHLTFKSEFEVAILPFHSFMELVGREKQMNTLQAVHRALTPGGRFFCTMHNPKIRRRAVDGIMRGSGSFVHGTETIVVTGFETGGNPVVKRSQFIERFDGTGMMISRIHQPMEFELIEHDHFRDLAVQAGFAITRVYGDYDGGLFDASTSPVMIWELEKP